MNRNQVIGLGVAGVFIVGDVAAAFEMGRACTRNCMGVPFAVIPELVHVPHGNNNSHYISDAPVMGIAGGSGNNNAS